MVARLEIEYEVRCAKGHIESIYVPAFPDRDGRVAIHGADVVLGQVCPLCATRWHRKRPQPLTPLRARLVTTVAGEEVGPVIW